VQSLLGLIAEMLAIAVVSLLRLPALILRRPIIGMLWLLLRPLLRADCAVAPGILLPTL
jgi:hypothetical protein